MREEAVPGRSLWGVARAWSIGIFSGVQTRQQLQKVDEGRWKRGVGDEKRSTLVSSQFSLGETDCKQCLPVVFLGQRISCKSYGSAPIKAGVT